MTANAPSSASSRTPARRRRSRLPQSHSARYAGTQEPIRDRDAVVAPEIDALARDHEEIDQHCGAPSAAETRSARCRGGKSPRRKEHGPRRIRQRREMIDARRRHDEGGRIRKMPARCERVRLTTGPPCSCHSIRTARLGPSLVVRRSGIRQDPRRIHVAHHEMARRDSRCGSRGARLDRQRLRFGGGGGKRMTEQRADRARVRDREHGVVVAGRAGGSAANHAPVRRIRLGRKLSPAGALPG